MGNSIGLVGYSIRVRKRGSRDSYLILDDCINGDSLFNLVCLYLKERQDEKGVDEDLETAIKIRDINIFGNSLRVDGIIQIGKYGFSAEIQNLETDEIFNRDVLDCEYIPLYFLFEFKEGQDEGIVILQKFGPYACKTPLGRDFNEFIPPHDEEVVVELNPLVCDSMIEHLIGGGIKQIRYIRNYIPEDVAEDCKLDDNIGVSATMETVIKAKREQFLDIPWWMRDFFNGRVRRNNLIEIQDIEYDDVKIKISKEGKPKTISLSDLETLQMSFDITDEVTVDVSGHPTIESIREVSENYLIDYRAGMEWEDD